MTESNDTTTGATGSGGYGESGGAGRRQDQLGSAAEEALKLLDALQQRVGREFGKGLVKGGVSGLGGAVGGRIGGAFGGGGGASRTDDVWSEAVAGGHDDEYICRACPVCRVIAARKEAGGDVADHLMAAGGELFAAVRQAFDALQRASTGSAESRPPREPRVEHIDLG
ncbi:DUF5304 domain-containing protein [Planotetraspora sp. A-T 1434]|uniref:DUF5304 domain-containing protein n=1 Tax=Planotetraspora sp. A-T 1434 TaxID=2979219 RepID=UPI0021C0CD43|nr:DUF5304 domain-containing protein [Planotetraspora sp. A-T 1434]MCT9930136.1 DUF5304 domain-containing protein [Planotetraspora sp. A-T 1434]